MTKAQTEREAAKRRAEIRKRRAAGETLQAIADSEGISRQRVWQILNPEYEKARLRVYGR